MNRKTSSTTGQTAEWIQLDRTICEQMMACVPDIQRTMKRGNLAKITRDIEAGKWKQTGEPLIISKKGSLINGQHRIKAFLQTDFYPETLVVSGVDHVDGYKAIDIGQTRTYGDVFKAHEIPDYTVASSISRRLMRLVAKDLCKGSAMPLTAQDLLGCYAQNREKIVFWKCKHSDLNNLISQVIRAAISAYAEDYIGREKVMQFWDEVLTGIGSGGAGSLRRALIVNANKSRGRYNHDEIAFITLTAMQMYQTGAKQRSLKVSKHVPYFH